jgi:hypothetical protein
MSIIDYIPHGKQNAVRLDSLVKQTGTPPREVRREIERIRHTTAVINSQDGKGYYRPNLPDDAFELARYIAQEEHRAKKIFYNLRGAKKALSQRGD